MYITIRKQRANKVTKFTYSDELYSDFHKDTYGFRPRGNGGVHSWDTLAPAEKQEAWDYMAKKMAEDSEEERLHEITLIKEFKSWIADTIKLGAGNEENALRWVTQNETFYHSQDVEQWVWGQGFLFTDYGRGLVETLKKLVKYAD